VPGEVRLHGVPKELRKPISLRIAPAVLSHGLPPDDPRPLARRSPGCEHRTYANPVKRWQGMNDSVTPGRRPRK
jgi:hypothetical protein